MIISYWGRLVCLFQIMLLAASTSQALRAQQPPAASDRILNVVRSGDSSFDLLLDSNFAGLRNVKWFSDIEPTLVIVQNQSSQDVLALNVSWSITTPQGDTQQISLPIFSDPGAETGTAEPRKMVMPSKGVRLISPLFDLDTGRFQALLETNAIVIMFDYFRRDPLAGLMKTAVAIDINRDVIYRDGLIDEKAGSDLYDRYRAEEIGERDEAISVAALIQKNTSTDQLASLLSADILKGLRTAGSDSFSRYTEVRGRYAQMYLNVLEGSSGRNTLQSLSERISKTKLTTIKRVTSQTSR